MAHIVVGLIMGIAFGFALEKSRVFEPVALLRQFQLRNFLMVKVFFSAIATSMITITTLKHLAPDFAFDLTPLYPLANICGGLLLGTGVALTGACPGTVIAQVGAGYRDARFTLLGGLLGATTYVFVKDTLIDPFFFAHPATPVTFSQLLGVPFEWLAAASLIGIASLLYFLERRSPWKHDVQALEISE
jgi:uncharacterized protein